MAGLFNINEALAWLDARRRAAAGEAGNLVTNPVETTQRLGSAIGSDLAGQAQGLLTASQNARSAIPELRQEAQDKLMSGLLNMGGMAGVMTYHGTPHKFSNYDLSKIGTGEGAQVYGHGIYFAENPNTADFYKNALSYGKNATIEGGGTKTEIPRWLADNIDNFGVDTAIRDWAERVQLAKDELHTSLQPWVTQEKLQGLQKTLNELQKIKSSGEQKITKPGTTYKQDLPDEVLPSLLQWDKPLSEQPAAVKAALRKSDFAPDESVWPHYTGQQFVQGEMAANGPYNAAGWPTSAAGVPIADKLRSLGIPGLSYLDAGSRGSGQGTLNHVIWDQGLLNRMIPTPVE